MTKKDRAELLRHLALELFLYAVLVVIYFFLALRFLGDPLQELFREHRVGYALVSLLLILLQGVLLDYVTSFLLDRLKLGRMK